MKRTSKEKPYLSWCLTLRNCEKTVEATFKSLRERTPEAEIVVVDTCSSDSTPEIAQRYADVFEVYTGPNNDWNKESFAVTDMAAARQRSFEIASGRWRAWADGDDRVLGGEEAKKYLELNGRFTPKPKPNYKLNADEETKMRKGEPSIGLEDFLRYLENNRPECTCVWSPYLYQRDPKNDVAIIWQERERIVRWDNPPKFRWSEPAHEVLVPIGNYRPPRIELPHLLFLHEKKFSGEDYEYSLKRHSAIMLKQYEEGDFTFRRCRYLANFASQLFPERELEFLKKAHEVAWTPMDKYRCLIDIGNYYARRGFYADSKEAHGAAMESHPHLPDAFYAAGQVSYDMEDWDRAVISLRKGVNCEISAESEINPRDHTTKWPSVLSLALQKAAEARVKIGVHDDAEGLFHEATSHSEKVRNLPEALADRIEAQALFLRARNKALGHSAILGLKRAWEYLKNNDEPQKALNLIEAFPWNGEDHPIKIEMEIWARKIKEHIINPEAYKKFYNAAMETGYKPMPEEFYELDRAHPRVQWTVKWIQSNKPKAKVLDVGCCDGICGIPLILTCPDVEYHGIDVNQEALDNFTRILDHYKITKSVALRKAERPIKELVGTYDVVIVGEIIEHVPDPVNWLREIRTYVKTDGVVLCTTPYGSFDEGHPPPTTYFGTPRDERGHLRAYSVKKCYDHFTAAGLVVDSISRQGKLEENGWAMLIVAHKESHYLPVSGGRVTAKKPIAVAVSGSLWDWNGSKVDVEGIGASEEMIVRLGEYLSKEREYSVFGPVPEPEVYKGVGYFNRETIRNFKGKLVVSRAPSYIKQLDAWIGEKLPAILWLQDTVYPDFTNEIAERYEKIVCVSNWHKLFTMFSHKLSPETADKIEVIYNFVQREHFEEGLRTGWKDLKDRKHFIYASSPDRGLIKLLKLWPRILEIEPEATLSIFYGWKGAARLGGGTDPGWNKRYLESRREYEKLRFQKGIKEIGMVNHYQIAAEFQRASIWSYSTDFAETCCTNALKARAAGAIPVTSSFAALNETAVSKISTLVSLTDKGQFSPEYDEQFLDGVRKALDRTVKERQEMAEEAIENFSFEAMKKKWDAIL